MEVVKQGPLEGKVQVVSEPRKLCAKCSAYVHMSIFLERGSVAPSSWKTSGREGGEEMKSFGKNLAFKKIYWGWFNAEISWKKRWKDLFFHSLKPIKSTNIYWTPTMYESLRNTLGIVMKIEWAIKSWCCSREHWLTLAEHILCARTIMHINKIIKNNHINFKALYIILNLKEYMHWELSDSEASP